MQSAAHLTANTTILSREKQLQITALLWTLFHCSHSNYWNVWFHAKRLTLAYLAEAHIWRGMFAIIVFIQRAKAEWDLNRGSNSLQCQTSWCNRGITRAWNMSEHRPRFPKGLFEAWGFVDDCFCQMLMQDLGKGFGPDVCDSLRHLSIKGRFAKAHTTWKPNWGKTICLLSDIILIKCLRLAWKH